MDPSQLSSLMNNPDMMENMGKMMQNPEIQNLLNNKDLMSNMMNMFGGAGLNNNLFNNTNTSKDTSEPLDTSEMSQNNNILDDESSELTEQEITLDNLENVKLEDLDNTMDVLDRGDIVELYNLKSNNYNNLYAEVLKYIEGKDRYLVSLIEYEKEILVKRENLILRDIEELDGESDGTIESSTSDFDDAEVEVTEVEAGAEAAEACEVDAEACEVEAAEVDAAEATTESEA